MHDSTMKPSKLWLRNPKDLISPLSKSTENLPAAHSPTLKNDDNTTGSPSPPPMISGVEKCFPPCARNPSVIRKNTQVCGDLDIVSFQRQESEPLPKKRRLLDVQDHNGNHEEEGSPSVQSVESTEDDSVISCPDTDEKPSEIVCNDDDKEENINDVVQREESRRASCENNPEIQEIRTENDSESNIPDNKSPSPDNKGVIKSVVINQSDKLDDNKLSPKVDSEISFDKSEAKENSSTNSTNTNVDKYLPNDEKTFQSSQNPSFISQSLHSNAEGKCNGNIITRANSPVLKNNEMQGDLLSFNNLSAVEGNRKGLESSIDEVQDILAKACHAVGLDEGPVDISDIIEDTNFSYPFTYDVLNPTAVDAYHKEHQDMRLPYCPPQISKDFPYQPRHPLMKNNNKYYHYPPAPHFPHNSYPGTQNTPMYRGHPPYPLQKPARYNFPYRVPYQEHVIQPPAYPYPSQYPPKPQSYPFSDPYYCYRYPQHSNHYQQRPHFQLTHAENHYPWSENYPANFRMDPKHMHYYYRYPVRPPALPATNHYPYSETSTNFKPCRYESVSSNVRQRNHYSYAAKQHPEVPGVPHITTSMNNDTCFPNQTNQEVRTIRSSSISPQEYSGQRASYSPIRSPITPVVFHNSQASIVPRIPNTVHSNSENNDTLNTNFPVAPVPMKYSDVTESKTVSSSHKSNQNASNKHTPNFENSLPNYQANSKSQGPYVIEKVRQYSYPPGHYNDWKVPTYNSNSDSNKHPSHMSNGIDSGVGCVSKTATYHNSINSDGSSSHSNQLTKSTVTDKNAGYKCAPPSYNYSVNYHPQMYAGHDKCHPHTSQLGGVQTTNENCKLRKLQENRQIIHSSKSQAMTNKKKSSPKNYSMPNHTSNSISSLGSKHDIPVTNLPKSYPSYNPHSYKDYPQKTYNPSENCHNYYQFAQENNHLHSQNSHLHGYNETSSVVYKNSLHNTQETITENHCESVSKQNDKIANEFSDLPNLNSSSVSKESTHSHVSPTKLASYHEPNYSFNNTSPDSGNEKDSPGPVILTRNLQSNPGSEAQSNMLRERQDSLGKEPKKRSHSLPGDITIGPFILNKGYATFANQHDDEADMLLFKQKLLPVIDHLLSIPEAANLRPLRNNPDELLGHLVKMWGGKGSNSTALDSHQRMKENFVSVVKFLFKPHLLSVWGWDKAPPEQILDELLNTSEQGQLLSQLTLGDLGHQSSALQFPSRSSSSLDDDEVFLPATFTCNDITEDVFNYFDIIDTSSAPDSGFNECSSEDNAVSKSNKDAKTFVCKTNCNSEDREEEFSVEIPIENCATLLTENRQEGEIHPNLSSVEDMIPCILEENLMENEAWKTGTAPRADFNSSSYLGKVRQGLYLQNDTSNSDEDTQCVQDGKCSEISENTTGDQNMPVITPNGLEHSSPYNLDNTYSTDCNKFGNNETEAENNITEWDKLAEHLIEYKKQLTLNEKNCKSNAAHEFRTESSKTSLPRKNSSRFEVARKCEFNCTLENSNLTSSLSEKFSTSCIKEPSTFSHDFEKTEDIENSYEEKKIVDETTKLNNVQNEKMEAEVINEEHCNTSAKCTDELSPVHSPTCTSILTATSEGDPDLAASNPDKIHRSDSQETLKADSNFSENDNKSPQTPPNNQPEKLLVSTENICDSNTVLRTGGSESKVSGSAKVHEDNPCSSANSVSAQKICKRKTLAEKKHENLTDSAINSKSKRRSNEKNQNIQQNCVQTRETSQDKTVMCLKDRFRVRKIYSTKGALKRKTAVTDYTAIFQKYVESKMLLDSEVTKVSQGNTNVSYSSI